MGLRSQILIDALDEALAGVEAASSLVGQVIPPAAEEWAERNGLAVQRTAFAPVGQLYIIGAVPVPDVPPHFFGARARALYESPIGRA